jgi:hypothetical protein
MYPRQAVSMIDTVLERSKLLLILLPSVNPEKEVFCIQCLFSLFTPSKQGHQMKLWEKNQNVAQPVFN